MLQTSIMVSVSELQEALKLKKRYTISDELDEINEEYLSDFQVGEQLLYSELSGAINSTYLDFMKKNETSFNERKKVLSSFKNKLLIFLLRLQNRNLEKIKNVDDYMEKMEEEKLIRNMSIAEFEDTMLTINTFPEMVECNKVIPLGTKIYWLKSSESFISDGKFFITEDELVSAELSKSSLNFDSDPAVEIKYHTKQGLNFSLERYISSEEIFYASQNRRLFTSFEAACEAIDSLMSGLDITFVNSSDAEVDGELLNFKLKAEIDPIEKSSFKVLKTDPSNKKSKLSHQE